MPMSSSDDRNADAFSFATQSPMLFAQGFGWWLRQLDYLAEAGGETARRINSYAAELGKVTAVSELIQLNAAEARRAMEEANRHGHALARLALAPASVKTGA
jgi:hypothetical protein